MLKIVNSKSGVAILSILGLSAVTACSCRTVVYGETQEEYANSARCTEPSVSYNLNTSGVCQSDIGMTYRYSRWVYYTINKENLPKGDDNKEYIPPIGISNRDVGIIYDDSAMNDALGGWLTVDPSMSDCIVENGGFWRRGYFQYKEGLFQTRSYNGKIFGATQEGIAPIGFTGRSSDNIHNAFDVGWNDSTHSLDEKYPEEFTVNGVKKKFELGQQTLYYGDNTKVWAKMDQEKGMIGDSEAEGLYRSFSGDSEGFDYGDYFLSNYDASLSGDLYDGGAGNATVLFCYSDSSPFGGMVQIGSSASTYAYNSKTPNNSAEMGVKKDSTRVGGNTIDLGKVNTQNYKPGHALMQVSKVNDKSGKTDYQATMSLNGATEYVYNGTNWVKGTSAIKKEASASITATSTPEFTLKEGENKICINLSYKERQNDSAYQNLEACAKVSYTPNIAKIASITKANVKIGGNSDEFKSSPNSVKTDASKTEIRPGLVTITWSHEIYAYCEYVLGNTASCGNSSTDIGGSLGRSYNAHYAADLGGLSASSSYKTLGTKNNVDLGQKTNKYLFPGERYTEEGDIWHYKEERSDGSPNGTGDGNKINSGVKVTLTASEIVCSINGEKFGLNNPRNYGRLTVIKTGGTNGTYYYGNYSDGTWKDDGSIWLNPYDNIQLRYEACIGSQISKDKESRAAWSDKLANEHNASLAVKTTGNAFDKTLYKGSGNAVDGALSGGKNIISSEVIGDNIQGHISNNYQFIGSKAVKTSNAVVGHLGQTINNDFGGDFSGCGGGRTDCLARATMKIPYNYILEPTVSGGSGGDIVTLGDSNTFQISINNKDVRTNEKVQSTPYHTNVKPGTTAGYLKFAANTETTTSELLKSINGKFVRGNYTSNIEDALASAGLDDIENPESGVINQLNNNGGIKNNAERYIKVSSDIAESDYNKICVALAVYPADSHNKEGAEKISDDDQSVALTGEFGGAYTRISVACKTVGKYPSASVEGNGIVTGSIITGSRTEYGGRSFGSWTEYGLVANGVTNIASGASSAYDNPQSSRNASVPYNEAGLKIGNFDSIQTIGNMASTIGAFSNASVYAAQARIYADSVIATFFNDDLGAGPIVDAGGATYVNANYDSDVAIDSDLAELINEAANNGQVIIYSTGDIKISNAVTELNATLIADGKVDTCTEADQGGDNEQLLDNCSNSLIINGVVYSEQPIALDRVYGGGSVEAMDLDADTLIQRAEILNYDPKIVKWSYDYKRQTQPLTTTYIEELSTRY